MEALSKMIYEPARHIRQIETKKQRKKKPTPFLCLNGTQWGQYREYLGGPLWAVCSQLSIAFDPAGGPY